VFAQTEVQAVQAQCAFDVESARSDKRARGAQRYSPSSTRENTVLLPPRNDAARYAEIYPFAAVWLPVHATIHVYRHY